MYKLHFLTFNLFLLLLPKYLFRTNYIDDFLDDFDIKYEKNLKKNLKKYLNQNKLLDNDRLVEPDEMRKILIDVLLDGEPIDEFDNFTKEIYEELTKIFIEKYYKDKKKIRGKDVYDLINMNEIIEKFYELNGEMPIYDDYEDLMIDDDDDNNNDDGDTDDDLYDGDL